MNRLKLDKSFLIRNVIVSAIFIFAAMLILFFTSKSSPLYMFNGDADTNVFMLVSKQMQNCKIIYKDIFDHKGPIWYLFFNTIYSFTDSVYCLYPAQIISAYIFFIYARKSVKLFVDGDKKSDLISCAYCISIMLSPVINSGKPDEFALPFMAYAIYLMSYYLKAGREIKWYQYLFVGLHIGIFFWIKFTICMPYLVFFVLLLKQKHPHMVRNTVLTLFGFLLVTGGVLLYFYQNDALFNLFDVYFHANLFEYKETNIPYPLILVYNIFEFFYSYSFFWFIVLFVMIFVIHECHGNKEFHNKIKPFLILFCGMLGCSLLEMIVVRPCYMSYHTPLFAGVPLMIYMVRECFVSNEALKQRFTGFYTKIIGTVRSKSIFIAVVCFFFALQFAVTMSNNMDRVIYPPTIFDSNYSEHTLYRMAAYVNAHPHGKIRMIGGFDKGYNQLLDFKYYADEEYYITSVYPRLEDMNAGIKQAIIDRKYDYFILENPPDEWDKNKDFLEANDYEMVVANDETDKWLLYDRIRCGLFVKREFLVGEDMT